MLLMLLSCLQTQFVEAMSTLSGAAKTAARTGYEYFNALASASSFFPTDSAQLPSSVPPLHHLHDLNGSFFFSTRPTSFNAHLRAQSVAPPEAGGGAIVTEDINDHHDQETDSGKKGRKKRNKRTRKESDPNLPKRPMSAYMQFIQAARPAIKEDYGGKVVGKEVITEAAARWGALTVEKKKVRYLVVSACGKRGVEEWGGVG